MTLWVFISVLSYVFFGLAFFGDKLVLSGPPNPKLYTFYVGALNILVIFLLPFTPLAFYNLPGLFWAFLTALVSILGIYTMFSALEKFEVSRVMSTIGATQPLFVLVLTGLFWGFAALTRANLLAFGMLLAGSILISLEKKFTITWRYIILTTVSSFLFSLGYIFSKKVFLHMPFFHGLAIIGLCTFACAMTLLLDPKMRRRIFSKNQPMDKKTSVIFLFTQSAGGIANVLQSFAISLVPVSSLALVNSLRGVQYVFLFLITLFFSFFFPRILKEDISKRAVIQKTAAILLIVAGLAILI